MFHQHKQHVLWPGVLLSYSLVLQLFSKVFWSEQPLFSWPCCAEAWTAQEAQIALCPMHVNLHARHLYIQTVCSANLCSGSCWSTAKACTVLEHVRPPRLFFGSTMLVLQCVHECAGLQGPCRAGRHQSDARLLKCQMVFPSRSWHAGRLAGTADSNVWGGWRSCADRAPQISRTMLRPYYMPRQHFIRGRDSPFTSL